MGTTSSSIAPIRVPLDWTTLRFDFIERSPAESRQSVSSSRSLRQTAFDNNNVCTMRASHRTAQHCLTHTHTHTHRRPNRPAVSSRSFLVRRVPASSLTHCCNYNCHHRHHYFKLSRGRTHQRTHSNIRTQTLGERVSVRERACPPVRWCAARAFSSLTD